MRVYVCKRGGTPFWVDGSCKSCRLSGAVRCLSGEVKVKIDSLV